MCVAWALMKMIVAGGLGRTNGCHSHRWVLFLDVSRTNKVRHTKLVESQATKGSERNRIQKRNRVVDLDPKNKLA